MTEMKFKRNFCIVAHIDHGKSTLADRLIQKAKIIDDRQMMNQILDNMDIERERGITIKSQAVTIPYRAKDGNDYELNFVDTPGHVDFSYEVSRAIASCEGALLLIDASQGVESQTVSNLYMAMEHDLTIVPVINKIDLPSADIPSVKKQIDHDLGLDSADAVPVSAKTGAGVDELFEAIVTKFPAPTGNPDGKAQALIFDCHYDEYRGVVIHIRVKEGRIKKGDTIRFMSNGADYKVDQIGIFRIQYEERQFLEAGDVGYIIAGVKTVSDVRVGDTVTLAGDPAASPLPGFKDVKPVVFSSIYPLDSNDYEELRDSMEKLKLNDASLVYEKDNSLALGNGFRCGFLGLLHLEIIQERLERDYDQAVIFTAPSVQYRVKMPNGEEKIIDNPTEFPEGRVEASEPYIDASIITPAEYIGSIMNLCTEKRGVQKNMSYLDEKRVELVYEMPLSEVLFDFYDKLKSYSRGYASFDYELTDYQPTELVKVDILLNGKPVDALAQLAYKPSAAARAKKVCERLKDEISRQQFKIAIQGAIGSQIIARETVNPVRKDVLAKCYGGDVTRKRKLLEKQKEGKKRMKMIGNVELPQSAFLAVLKEKEE
ncbi:MULTISPECIES: translation elongation factor 4 [Treponema]|uniref:Elongation factor 4 n=2 Tax=Treponema saccharophilum TaxID=165 RepID=H7EH76_9SPIR|nr:MULTISPECIES: translation elongation factor 4 [Treponema]EIC03075.1 GTP-binding protein LepA [Treponema saccharophilum DSM 2985]MBQ5536410.1 translation elongation factor 4 [Treponema sp.]BDC96343.1 elongation factor 4 [Treponema saccharophilum]